MKTGLVLEGGAMRGMFTAGVLDFFIDNDIKIDAAVGVSAGALFGVNFVSKQRERVIRYNKRFNGDKNYMGILPLLREGNIVSTQYAYHDVPHELDPFDDESYMKSTTEFYAVCTDIDSGAPHYIRINSVFGQMDYLRASGSMPFVSKPVELDGRRWLDGGISDSIPFRWLSEQGCDRLIVILTRDMEYRKKPMSKSLIRMFYPKNKVLRHMLYNRHEEYNHAVSLLKIWEKKGKAFVIRPSSPIEIGRLESSPEKLQSVYDMGLKVGSDCIAQLKEYLSEDCKAAE